MNQTTQKDHLYLNATSYFLRALYESKRIEELQVLNMSGWSEARFDSSGSLYTDDPASYQDWQNGMNQLLGKDDLKGNEALLYFEVMRCYIREWFLRGKRYEVYLRDIPSWTEFSKDYKGQTTVKTVNPDMWPLWLESVPKATHCIES